MKKILYMHTGSANHGCEALVRTSAQLLGGPKDVRLWSCAREEDIKYGSSKKVEKVYSSEEIKRYSVAHFEAMFKRIILKQSDANQKIFLREVFKNNIAISIGGDNYCYPWSAKQAINLDKEIRKHCKASVLWGCSIDPEAITPEMEEDLKGFDLITARESITYSILKDINPNTVLVADPAFLLESERLPLPKHFLEKNTVGINVSPLIMQYGTQSKMIMDNYRLLIRYIIEKTDMNVCLIPHVVWENNDDRIPCKELFEEFKGSERICMVDDCNCEQLKGYISRCRFFVGARTHSTIAAYSTCVPTLVVGYSVKSRGIARDLFGDEKNYVYSVQNMKTKEDLLNKFKWIYCNETNIQKRLKEYIPFYIEKAKLAIEYVNKLEG